MGFNWPPTRWPGDNFITVAPVAPAARRLSREPALRPSKGHLALAI